MALKEILETMKKPHAVTFESSELNETYGKFIAQPFERGYAVTIGNALRRVLLSSIPGYAISAIRIDGASSEYENIDGVKEDTLMIILAMKKLVVKLQEDVDAKMIHIEKEGPATLTGADISDADSGIEVLNKDLVLANISEGGKIIMDLQIDCGYGYVPSEMNQDLVQEIGAITLDAIYSPIVRVRFEVEDVRVGQRTDYGKLILEVETNGTISPDKAVSWAAKILRTNLFPFLDIEEAEEEKALEESSREESVLDKLKHQHIEDVGFSVRTVTFLHNADLKTLDKIAVKSEDDLMRVPGASSEVVDEIKEKLEEYDVELGYRPKVS